MDKLVGNASHSNVLEKLNELYWNLFEHDGFGEVKIEMKILRRGQKEVILHCGKQYRFVVDGPVDQQPSEWEKAKALLMTDLAEIGSVKK